ncbi:ComEA family DNA-binding protein [soil metagenome]
MYRPDRARREFPQVSGSSTIGGLSGRPAALLPSVGAVQRGAEGQGVTGRISTVALRLLAADRLAGVLAPNPAEPGGREGDRAVRRWNPGRRAALAMAVTALLSLGAAGAWVAASQPSTLSGGVSESAPTAAAPEPAASVSAGGSTRQPATSASSVAAASFVVVDVVGKVKKPGVYRLGTGARVDDAIRAAGGTIPGVDLALVNLARKLTDGEQVAVGVTGAGAGNGAGAGPVSTGQSGGPSAGAPVNLNTASAEQLDSLPGVGPVLAQRIVDWRTAHGGFGSVDQLRSVSGIGDAKYSDLKTLVTV